MNWRRYAPALTLKQFIASACWSIAASLIATTAMSQSPPAADSYRPAIHFSPQRNWINDPNGLIWHDGEYHLFYQYNPQGDRWGEIGWGHAVSADRLRWQELPLAIPADAAYFIFSGSIVVDSANTSGLGLPGNPAMVAIYTGAQRREGGVQNQQLAFSTDRGRTWTKYAGNPVLDVGLKNFRDPKVFWHAPTSRWIMVVVRSDDRAIDFYAAKDLIHWTRLSSFKSPNVGDGIWECPDLFELAVEASSDKAWVLKVDIFNGHPGGSSGGEYFVGDFDGQRFTPRGDAAAARRWSDFGADFYASASWTPVAGPDPRPVWIAWMNNHAYASDTPTSPWRGAMTLPRSLSLRREGAALTLVQQPLVEMQALRQAVLTPAAVTVSSGRKAIAPPLPAQTAIEISLTLDPGDAAEAGLKIETGDGEFTTVGYEATSRSVFIDRSASGLMAKDPRFSGRRRAPRATGASGPVQLRLFVDSSAIEVFADDGSLTLTEIVFPTGSTRQLYAQAQGGKASLSEIRIWPLAASR